MTEWNLEGYTVEGLYLGEYPVRGTVISERVKYGGQVQLVIQLDQPINLFGLVRDHVLMTTDEIQVVASYSLSIPQDTWTIGTPL
jgi:hypothetical protein